MFRQFCGKFGVRRQGLVPAQFRRTMSVSFGLQLSDAEASALFAHLDADRNGRLELQEFFRAILAKNRTGPRWFDENKDSPTRAAAPPPPPYSASDAARVKALMARLRLSQADVARAIGESSNSALSKWLGGRNTRRPHVLRVGAAAMRWFEENKDRPTLL